MIVAPADFNEKIAQFLREGQILEKKSTNTPLVSEQINRYSLIQKLLNWQRWKLVASHYCCSCHMQ
jgi:hypothetical protein